MFGKSKLSDSNPNRNPMPDPPPPAWTTTRVNGTATAPVADSLQKLGMVPAPADKPSVISDAVDFVGEFRTSGSLHIDGKAKGTIEAESVTVGPGGSLEGVVACRKLQVKGRFSGEVTCDELLVANEASVAGSLRYRTILVQRGAHVVGDFLVID